MVRTSLPLVFVLALGACDRAESRPEEALESFLREVRFGRGLAAWKRLSKGTREALRDRHRALAEASGQTAEPPEPSELLFSVLDLTVLSPAESIVVVSPPGDVVTLRVSVAGGQSAEVRMVKEQGRWRVDLRDILEEDQRPHPPS